MKYIEKIENVCNEVLLKEYMTKDLGNVILDVIKNYGDLLEERIIAKSDTYMQFENNYDAEVSIERNDFGNMDSINIMVFTKQSNKYEGILSLCEYNNTYASKATIFLSTLDKNHTGSIYDEKTHGFLNFSVGDTNGHFNYSSIYHANFNTKTIRRETIKFYYEPASDHEKTKKEFSFNPEKLNFTKDKKIFKSR